MRFWWRYSRFLLALWISLFRTPENNHQHEVHCKLLNANCLKFQFHWREKKRISRKFHENINHKWKDIAKVIEIWEADFQLQSDFMNNLFADCVFPLRRPCMGCTTNWLHFNNTYPNHQVKLFNYQRLITSN